MKLKVVTLEMAKTLRKKGYRELCLAFYGFNGELCNAEGTDPILKDYNAPKPTRGRGPRCYSAPTLSSVQDWLRYKHYEVLVCKDTFFESKPTYFCRITRMKDGLSRDTKPFRSYDQALLDAIKHAITLLR